MRLFIITFITISVLYSCSNGNKTDIVAFKKGNFKTYLGEQKDSSVFYRDDHIQIERYKNQIDTFAIKWKSNFEYELKKINPKSKLDSIPFVVKITGIKENTYNFKGSYLGSNFKQEGITVKISN